MRVAIYIRVSTDEQSASADAQEAGARGWASAQGAEVVAVYRDEGASGAEWVTRRGVLQLLADVTATPRPWDVLVVRDLDRLGRDALRLGLAVETLHDHGAQCVAWSTGETLRADPMARALLMMRGVLAEQERAQIAHRTRTALRQRAERGMVVGGRCYGYRNVRSADGVRYEVDPAEADVVREVFRLAGEGASARTIAHALNARGLPSPRAGARGTGSWSTSQVYEMLRHVRYRGELRWGEVGSTYRAGTRIATRSDDVVSVTVPDLAIVDAATWERAQSERTAGRVARGLTRRGSQAPRYLLVGLAVCGLCGGPIASASTSYGVPPRRRIVRAYACLWHRDRGRTVCTASYTRPMDRVDAVVLDWLAAEVLSPERLAAAARDARAALARARTEPDAAVVELRREEAAHVAAVDRLTAAVAEGAGAVPELARALVDRSRRLGEVRAELARRAATVAAELPPEDLDARIAAVLGRVRATLAAHPERAREILAAVLVGRVRVTPTGPRGPLMLEAEAAPGALLRAGVAAGGVAAEPVGVADSSPSWDDLEARLSSVRVGLRRFSRAA